MLQSGALSSWLPVHLGCFFCASLLLDAGTWAAQVTAPQSNAAGSAEPGQSASTTSVFADVRWTGLCNDRGALEAALRDRGSSLQQPGIDSAHGGNDRFALQVDVRASSRGSGYAARVSIASDNGAHEVRELDAGKCDELHSAVAWVLVVLARRPRVSADTQRESDATTKSANNLSGSEPGGATVSVASPASPIPPTNATAAARAREPNVHGYVLPRARSRFAFGAQLTGGWLFLREPAWGPTVFVEQRPWRTRSLTVRLSLLTLANQASGSEATISAAVRRNVARLGGALPIPATPLAVTSGLEAGWLSARGSGALVAHESRSLWAAWFVGIRVELPLLRERLWLESAADAVVSPFTYALRTSSARTLVESGPVELRAAVGLKSSF